MRSSRWSNVDRSSLTSSASSPRGGGGGGGGDNMDNQNNKNSNSNTNKNNTTDNIQAIFLDSFIKLFGLLNDYYDDTVNTYSSHQYPHPHPHVIEVHKYKAALAKGLTKSQNEIRSIY